MDSSFVPYIKASTVDDLIRTGYQALLDHGTEITPSKGAAIEISGISFELTNPRARLSQSATRGKIVSALGELCWYLSGSDSGKVMDYYLPGYSENNADDPTSILCSINGAYGPRIFGARPNQFDLVREILKRKPFSRQAVIQIFDSRDVAIQHRDVPCTCTLQFLIRSNRLNLIVHMRSNDAYLGMPHDIFSFTMLQEIMASSLSMGLGVYKHIVGSFHLYEKDVESAQKLLAEGWYATNVEMPVMPEKDFENSLKTLLELERQIREEDVVDQYVDDVDVYWSDLIKVLQAHRVAKNGDQHNFKKILNTIANPVYKSYLVPRLRD